MIEIIDLCRRVMQENNNNQDFSFLVRCTKDEYTNQGTSPNSNTTKNFYIRIDAIEELFIQKRITFKQANSEFIKAWQETIEASNLANRRGGSLNSAQDAAESFNRNQRYWECLKRPGAICIP